MSVLRVLLVAITAVVFVVVPSAQASTNVVPNPGFEQGGCGGNTPVICGWTANQSMAQDTTNSHSGSASLSLSGINAFPLWATTDPAFCALIGPGAHSASFWYRNTSSAVYLDAAFYQAADCTGPSAGDELQGLGPTTGDAWQEASGALVAPPGTRSALFWVGVETECDVLCEDPVWGNFDDVDVEGAVESTPAISSFTPTSGPVGASVDIQGTSFIGATSVKFNGTADPSFVVTSSTDITAHVPTGATTGQISVTTLGGTATSSSLFTILLPPTISSFTPASGPAGTTVDIHGTNFTGATCVKFNGTGDPSFVVNSPIDITAHVPAGATSGPISVTTPGGTATSGGLFTVTPSPPTITSFTPTSGPVGTSVSIAGTDFTGASSVTFNGAAASYTVNSPTSITAHVPSGATTGPISVTTPNATGTSSTTFTLTTPPPTVTSFAPTSGTVGTSVTITGTGFTGVTSVTFAGVSAASFTFNSDNSINAVVPAGAKTGSIAVTTHNGTGMSASNFTVTTPPPKITGFTPTQGHPGTSVTITGSNFTGAISVKLGTASAKFTVNSPTRITATVPAIPHGFYRWSVTNPAGTAISTSYFRVF